MKHETFFLRAVKLARLLYYLWVRIVPESATLAYVVVLQASIRLGWMALAWTNGLAFLCRATLKQKYVF